MTWVGVIPTHRRRGILRDLMRRELEDVHGWGEPIAALWASEASIYGRFGYGQAAPSGHVKSDRARFSLREEAAGSVRFVDADEAFELFPPVYERVRATRAGMLSRDERWWKEHRLADPESWRRGASRKFYAAVELDGAVEGYAYYRVKDEWEDGFPKGEVRVIEALATSVQAERALWSFLHGIDLVVRVVGPDLRSRLDVAPARSRSASARPARRRWALAAARRRGCSSPRPLVQARRIGGARGAR